MVKRLVIIGLVVPEPASTAAGTRMLQLIDLFRERNYEITFLTSAGNIEFSEKIDFQKIEINDSSFDELINNLDPDIVLFDRFVTEEQFGWRVSENCPQALKILEMLLQRFPAHPVRDEAVQLQTVILRLQKP